MEVHFSTQHIWPKVTIANYLVAVSEAQNVHIISNDSLMKKNKKTNSKLFRSLLGCRGTNGQF